MNIKNQLKCTSVKAAFSGFFIFLATSLILVYYLNRTLEHRVRSGENGVPFKGKRAE
jgi:hypothetical protein